MNFEYMDNKYMYTLHQAIPREPIINHRNTRINSQGNSHTHRIT